MEGRWHRPFVSQFAIPVPLTLIAHALGVDSADLARFKVWTDHLEMGYMEPLNNEQRFAVATSVLEFQDYIVDQIADRTANRPMTFSVRWSTPGWSGTRSSSMTSTRPVRIACPRPRSSP